MRESLGALFLFLFFLSLLTMFSHWCDGLVPFPIYLMSRLDSQDSFSLSCLLFYSIFIFASFLIDIITFTYFLFYINMRSFFSFIFVRMSKWKNYTKLWLCSLCANVVEWRLRAKLSDTDTYTQKNIHII